MPRQLKPQKVDEVRDKVRGITVDIMLNRNDLTFFAEVNGETLSGKSAGEVKETALKRIRESESLEWEAVIEISTGPFRFERYWLSRNSAGRTVKAPWHCDSDEARLRNAAPTHWSDDFEKRFQLPFLPRLAFKDKGHYYGRNNNAWVPHTEETWTALEQLRDRLRAIDVQVSRLILTRTGLDFLMGEGSAAIDHMLPPPVPPITDDGLTDADEA